MPYSTFSGLACPAGALGACRIFPAVPPPRRRLRVGPCPCTAGSAGEPRAARGADSNTAEKSSTAAQKAEARKRRGVVDGQIPCLQMPDGQGSAQCESHHSSEKVPIAQHPGDTTKSSGSRLVSRFRRSRTSPFFFAARNQAPWPGPDGGHTVGG